MVTTYSYDANTGELTSVTYSDSTPALSFTYNRLGQQATITDATGTRSFDYDPATLQLTAETLDSTFYDGLVLTRQYQTGHEPHGLKGRPSGYSLGTQPSPVASAAYSYTTQGRLHTISDGTDTFTYDYKSNSNLLASIEGPVHAVSYSYEPNRDLMSSIDNKAGNLSGSSISKYTYGHDALNRRTSRVQQGTAFEDEITNEPEPTVDIFDYNPRSEVIESKRYEGTDPQNPGDPIAPKAFSYEYDPIGNRRKSQIGTNPQRDYATNAVNQYTLLSGLTPSREPDHDEDGNLIDNGDGWTFAWNAENRLVQATDGTITIDFTYDYQGRLVKKDDGTDVKVYVYDDWNRIASFLHTSSLTLHNSYVWGMDLSGSMQGAGGVGGLLKEGDLYPLFDANGNIMQKLDDTGSIAMNVAYDPFGNIIDGTLVGEYGFSTKPLIDDLNWYYYGFRYYDPTTGRWPNRDPIEEQGGLNLYAFVGNDGVNAWDQLGLRPRGRSRSRGGPSCCGDSEYDPSIECCENDSVVAKVTIWVCKRPLRFRGRELPQCGPLSHSYVATKDPATTPAREMQSNRFGKQPRAGGEGGIIGPGYVVPEPTDFTTNPDDCKEREVCPAERERLTTEGKTSDGYFMFSPIHNCHGWARGRSS